MYIRYFCFSKLPNYPFTATAFNTTHLWPSKLWAADDAGWTLGSLCYTFGILLSTWW